LKRSCCATISPCKPGLQRALASVCGLGQYELTLNGKKAGDDYLSPGWTKYNKTCLYDTRDITSLLRQGKNAAGPVPRQRHV
jgi:alpha-L-rhamnosidase